MKSLHQWLESLQKTTPEDDTGIITTIQVQLDLTLFMGQKDDGSFSGEIGIQINLPSGNDQEYVLSGFLNAEEEEATPEGIAKTLSDAFGIKPDDVIWETEEIG